MIFSVVTVVYNSVAGVERTLQSVIAQTYPSIEFIVIDGGSTDGTVDIIKRYSNKINTFISERDGGIYDAMNKGVGYATGDYVLFLNAGDYFFSDDLFYKLNTEFSWAFGQNDLIYGSAKFYTRSGLISDLNFKHSHDELWKGPNFRHGALLVRTSVLKTTPFVISDELKIAADWDFIYNCYKKKLKFLNTKLTFIVFQEEGVSSNLYKHFYDHKLILKKYGDWKLVPISYLSYRIARKRLVEPTKKVSSILDVFFRQYLFNHLFTKVPFYWVRHVYLQKVVGIKLLKGASFHLNATVEGTNIFIGENSVINRRCHLDGRGKIHIGRNASISQEVQIITADHDYQSAEFSLRVQNVQIGDFVWVGSRAIILGGVTIGEGAVICAGAVVTKNVDAYSVVAGIPAKKIRERRKDLDYNTRWMGWFD